MRMGFGRWPRLVAAALTIGFAAAALPVPSHAASDVELAAATKQPRGSIYLFLGFAGVFSTGLNTLNDELRARGIPANVLGFSGWPAIAGEIEARYRTDKLALPVVIVGHSFGSDAALRMAAELGEKGIPVALVVTFDATAAIPVAANVRHLINFYAPTGIGKKLSPGKGFRGRLENIDATKLKPGINHVTIHQEPSLRRRVIAEIRRVYGGGAQASWQ